MARYKIKNRNSELKHFLFFMLLIICVIVNAATRVYMINNKNAELYLVSDSDTLNVNQKPEKAYQGFYYLKDGTYLGKIGNKNEVLVTDRFTYNALLVNDSIYPSKVVDLTQQCKLSHSDFLNRVNWTYGEGGGMAADFYASTIANMAEIDGEHGMYKHMNEGVKSNAANNKTKYFVEYDGTNGNYKRFKRYRKAILQNKSLDKGLKNHHKFLKEATRANISILLGNTEDITAGAINKAGGKNAILYSQLHNVPGQKMHVIKAVNKASGYTSYHIFYKLGKKQNTKQAYTLITMDDFNIVDSVEVLGDEIYLAEK